MEDVVDGADADAAFNMLTTPGATPEAANCAHRTLLAASPEAEVLALTGSDVPALLDLVAAAAYECDVPRDVVQAIVGAGL